MNIAFVCFELEKFLQHVDKIANFTRQKKCIAWFQISNCFLKITRILKKILEIDTFVILTNQKQKKRKRIVFVFNDEFEKNMIFFNIYDSKYFEFDLQKKCHYMHFLKSFYNKTMKNQTIHRCRRIKCFYDVVHVFEYYIENTIAFKFVQSNIKKYIFEIVVFMNNEIIDEKIELNVYH